MIVLPSPKPVGKPIVTAPSTLLTGLTSYWKLDEIGSGTRFDSVGTNHLTAVNAPVDDFGIINNGVQFATSASQRLTRASNAGLQVGNNDRTCSFWVKLWNKNAIFSLLGKSDGTGLGSEWRVLYRNSTDRFEAAWTQAAPITSISAVSSTAPTVAVWYHIVTWHDSVADQIGITVNTSGLATASLVGGCQSLPAISFDIGAESDGGLPADVSIDEVGWWSRVLTPTERTTLFNGGAATTHPFTGMP